MSKISPHFSREECRCKCGNCSFDTVDTELIQLMEMARAFVATPTTPNSVCRCESHNRSVGGSLKSQHLYGRACDFPCENPEALYEYLCAEFPAKFGFGLYDTFVHIDSRTNGPARWDYRKVK